MTRYLVPLLALLAGGCTGCFYTASVTGGWDLYTNSARNLAGAPVALCDENARARRARHLAASTWSAVSRSAPAGQYSWDYACGFKDGFADYLDSGGSGHPPAAPPARYRRYCHYGAGGQLAAQDWQAGFIHGAGVAKGSGVREALLTPIFDLPANGRSPGPDFAGPLPDSDTTTPPSPPDDLPAPRVLPDR